MPYTRDVTTSKKQYQKVIVLDRNQFGESKHCIIQLKALEIGVNLLRE